MKLAKLRESQQGFFPTRLLTLLNLGQQTVGCVFLSFLPSPPLHLFGSCTSEEEFTTGLYFQRLTAKWASSHWGAQFISMGLR